MFDPRGLGMTRNIGSGEIKGRIGEIRRIRAVWFLFFLTGAAQAGKPAFTPVPTDSLRPYANYLLSMSGSPILADSLFCDALVPVPPEAGNASPSGVSEFGCKLGRVREFTFTGYENGFAILLFKPYGSEETYFGKARIGQGAIRAAYRRVEQDAPVVGLSQKQTDKATGAIALTALILLAAVAVLSGFFGLIPGN